jgi:PAS domain S-box-containing protein
MIVCAAVCYAGAAIFMHGLDGRFTDVNRAACEMLGYAREELLAGMFRWDFVVRDSREAIQATGQRWN